LLPFSLSKTATKLLLFSHGMLIWLFVLPCMTLI